MRVTQVLEYGDFAPGDIVFSNENSSDPNIDTDNAADMIANDATFQVTGNQQTVGGTVSTGGQIFFRIGLKSKWSTNPAYNTTTNPARYAVVVISYKDNTLFQKIFLRQGHEPDYLMRPEDNNAAGNLESLSGGTAAIPRPEARKFTPYNLTHPDLKDGTNTGGANVTNHPVIPARGDMLTGHTAEDYFTAYPSQAGAFFQWANANQPRKAYHPTNRAGTLNGWQNNHPGSYWSTHEASHETCPPGYRRPTDGTTSANSTGAITSSEMRQSLWLNPKAGNGGGNIDNSVGGYYADGFFDRRQIGTQQNVYTDSYANTAVAVSTGDVAYIGRLFFNPATNASLFIPASGYRIYTSGELGCAGGNNYCWSSSSSSAANVWFLFVNSSAAYQNNINRSHGVSVRCVAE